MSVRNGLRRWLLGGVVLAGTILGFGTSRLVSAQSPLPPVLLDDKKADVEPAAGVGLPKLPPISLPGSSPTPAPVPVPPAPAPTTLPALPPVVLDDKKPEPKKADAVSLPKLPDVKPAPLPVPSMPADPVSLPKAPDVKPAEPIKPALPPQADFKLQPAEPLPNLKNAATPPAGELPPPRVTGNETLPLPTKVGNEVAPAPLPVIDVTPKTPPPPPPGEAPMLPLKETLLSAALGVALATSPTTAVKAEEPKKEVKTPKTADERIADLEKELAAVKVSRDELAKKLDGVADGKGVTLADKGLIKRVTELETLVDSLQGKLKALDATPRTAGSSPIADGTATGTVKLVNEYRTKVSIVVNGKSYPLDAGETKSLPVPTGGFSYTLIDSGSGIPTKDTIKEGETVTLRIK